MTQQKDDALRDAALNYHEFPTPGKLSVRVTKPMATQRDLSLAYSPGVPAACMLLADANDPIIISNAKPNPEIGHDYATAVLPHALIAPARSN